ncbi:hypothetical protein [Massilia sp. Root1485]|uniref:hypothetical protein n=1 Tax=Massilia sp. Root1485 TaxID=1736472 RepID=UPI0006FD8802|nr:hypothetical protein [Massilia sp. Root1485]KQZ34969.1 hypothetical protein ASD92_07685 [Massilia sp. Root1485]
MSLFISFDGPKGVGKTTLIELVVQRLLGDGHPVVALVEKDLIPEPEAALLRDLYAAMKQSPTVETDRAIADALKSARLMITQDVLSKLSDKLVLFDRWYPSDAVFRKFLPWTDTVAANIAAGVRIPDLTFAVSCDPEISWHRAASRARTLDSKVISNYDDHVRTTHSFDQAARHFGWQTVRSDDSFPEELANIVCSAIAADVERS